MADLQGWMRSVGGHECAALASALDLHDHAAELRVLAALVDCVLRRIVPLAKYERYPSVLPIVRALPPVTDAAGRAEARATLRTICPQGPSAVGSAAIALMHLDHFAEATSPEAAARAWQSLFYPSGCLYMAVWRTKRADATTGEVSAALCEMLGALTSR